MFLETVGIIVSKVTAFDLSIADSNKGDFLPKYLKFWEQQGLEGARVDVAVLWVFHMLFLKPRPEYLTRRVDFSDRIDSLRLLRILLAKENFPEGKKSTSTQELFYFLVNYNFILGYNGQVKLNHALYINPRYIKYTRGVQQTHTTYKLHLSQKK